MAVKTTQKIVHLRKFKCSICYKRFATDKKLQTHPSKTKQIMQQHRRLHTHKYKCYRCSSRFIDENELKIHFCQKSNKQPKKPKSIVINRCKICNIDFQSYQEHLAHKKQHAIYPCSYCPKSFTTKKLLWGHQDYMHTGKRAKLMKQNAESDGNEVRLSMDNITLTDAVNIPPQLMASVPIANNEPNFNSKYISL